MKNINLDIHHNDRWIIYFLIPFASILVSNIGIENFSTEILKPYFWPNNGWALVMGFSQYFLARYIYQKLDSIVPYYKALIIQLSVSLPVISILACLMDYFYVRVLWGYSWPVNSDFLLTELPMVWLWVIILYLIFLVMKMSSKNEPSHTVNADAPSYLQAYAGNKTMNISHDAIAYIYVEDKIAFLKTMDDYVYRIDKTLNELELSFNLFHRANRQLLIKKEAVAGFEIMPTRKLKLVLNPQHQKLQFVSKTKSTDFKKWMNSNDKK